MAVTVTNGHFSDLAWRDFRVVEGGGELGTDGPAGDWTWQEVRPRADLHIPRSRPYRDVPPVQPVENAKSRARIVEDAKDRLAGKCSIAVHVQPSGNPIVLTWPAGKKAGILLAGKTHLAFWSKIGNPNIHAWKGLMPVVTLYESAEKFAILRPFDDRGNYPQINECRANWTWTVIPVAGNALWRLQGELPDVVNYVTIEFYPWGSRPVTVWLDGMVLK